MDTSQKTPYNPRMFLLKKWITIFLAPFPLGLLLLLMGLLLLYTGKRSGRFFILIGTVLLIVFSLPWTANEFTEPLEKSYAPLVAPPENVTDIVVLGGGIHDTLEAPATMKLSNGSLARLIEGIRLAQLLPHSRLIVSGGNFHAKNTVADLMATAAISLGVAPGRIIQEKQSLDTADEARLLAPQLRGTHFILVTSAIHMPRAMQLFEAQGLHPIAAPCGFITEDTPTLLEAAPSASNLSTVSAAWHELIGKRWAQLVKAEKQHE